MNMENPNTVETLKSLRPLARQIRDTIAAIRHERPAPVPQAALDEVERAADAVRATKATVREAQQAVAEAEAECERLAGEDAADEALLAANGQLHEERLAFNMAMQRHRAAVQQQRTSAGKARQAAEKARNDRLALCNAIASETTAPGIREAATPNELPLGSLLAAAMWELDGVWRSFTSESLDRTTKEEVNDAITPLLEPALQIVSPAVAAVA